MSTENHEIFGGRKIVGPSQKISYSENVISIQAPFRWKYSENRKIDINENRKIDIKQIDPIVQIAQNFLLPQMYCDLQYQLIPDNSYYIYVLRPRKKFPYVEPG